MTMKAKLMTCVMALSVALAGYLSCLIASHIHWHYKWITAPAILPGLSFGLAIAGWLLHRGWIGRGKAVGLAVGSAVAYFAAYWSAFYTVVLCGSGMILSTLRLPLFHAGMIGGLAGTALLIASLAAVSADFRRKDWKTLILIGAAAGGALCLAGLGASANDHAGTLANPGDRVFIFVWQFLVSGYLGMLLLAAPDSFKRAERGRIAHRAACAVFALLVVSFVQAAIGYSRGDKENRVVSPDTSGNSNAQPSTPQGPQNSQNSTKVSPVERASTAKLREAAEKFSIGRYDEAFNLYNEILTSDSKNPTAYMGRGWALFCTGQNDAAVADFNQAISLSPNDAEGYLRRGMVLASKSEYASAIDDFSKSIQYQHDNTEAYYERGVARCKSNDFGKARDDFSEVIRLEPKRAAAYLGRARAFAGIAEAEKAVADCNRALELSPQNADIFLARGTIYLQGNKYKAAEEDLEHAASLRADYVPAYLKLASVYSAQENPALAALSMGRARYHSGEFEKAVEEFNHVVKLRPELAAGYFELGRSRLAQYILTVKHAKAGTATGGSYAEEEQYRAAIKDAVTRFAEPAVGSLNEAARLEPKNVKTYLELGKVSLCSGEDAASLRAMEKAVALDPRSAEAHFWLGLVKYFRGDKREDANVGFHDEVRAEQAIKDLDVAIELDPKHCGAHFFRGRAHGKLKNHKRAIQDQDQAIALCSDRASYPDLGVFRWSGLVARNYPDEIIASSVKAAAYADRAICYSDLRNDTARAHDLDEAIRFLPTSAQLFYLRGFFYDKADKRKLADFRRAAQLDPTNKYLEELVLSKTVDRHNSEWTPAQKFCAAMTTIIGAAILVDVLAGDSMSTYSASSEKMPGYIEPSWTMFMTQDEIDKDAGGWRY